MARSLRWRLQLWHAAILILAIFGFSGVLYLQFQRSVLREIDAELLAGARALEGTLKLAPRFVLESGFPEGPLDRPLGRGGPGRGPGPPGMRGLWDRLGGERPPDDRNREERESTRGDFEEPESAEQAERASSDRDRLPPGPPPEDEFGLEPEVRPGRPNRPRPMTPEQWMELLTLPRSIPRGPEFGPPGENSMAGGPPPQPRLMRPSYYAVFAANGSRLKSDPAAEAAGVGFARPFSSLEYRNREYRRELLLRGPENSVVIVGQDVRPQFDQIRWLGTQLLVIGLSVLGLGLVGGWWLAGRAIRPLEQIGETAQGIEASRLSERFNVDSTDTELRQLSETLNSMLGRLEAGFEQQNRFTADASHELRTPLAVLLSHAELALSRQRTPAEYQAALETVLRSGKRMKGLVEDLLVLARANSGRLELRPEPTDLRKLVEDATQLLRPLADSAEVRVEVQGEQVEAEVDPSRLSQALINLIGNAIKYNRQGGTVNVVVLSTPAAAIVRVSDTGEGIPAESLPHLFEPFYRVDAARSRETGGSGLGLAISRRIIGAHGGQISVSSEVGAGSQFEIRLPRLSESADRTRPELAG